MNIRTVWPRRIILVVIILLSLSTIAAAGIYVKGVAPPPPDDEDQYDEEVCTMLRQAGKRGPDCGQNPYALNTVTGKHERKFSAWCFDFTGDPNELLYDGLWCSETPLAC